MAGSFPVDFAGRKNGFKKCCGARWRGRSSPAIQPAERFARGNPATERTSRGRGRLPAAVHTCSSDRCWTRQSVAWLS